MRYRSVIVSLLLLLVLTACKPTTEPILDTTPPRILYQGEVVTNDLVITVDVFDASFAIRDLFTVDDDTDTSLTIADLSIDDDGFDQNEVDAYPVVLELTDAAGNTTQRTINIVVADFDPPSISMSSLEFPDTATVSDITAAITITDNYDNLENIEKNINFDNVIFNEPGIYEVVVTATDSSGNQSSETFAIELTETPFVPVDPVDDVDDGVIYYILESSIPAYYDYHIAAKAIQGVVNRNQPNLMIIDLNNAYYTYTDSIWKDYIEDEGYTFVELTSFLEILTTFEHYFSDIIAINDDYKSYNNWVASDADFGAMIAAVTYYMPVPEGVLYQAEQQLDIELIESFTLNGVLLSGYISDNFDFYNVSNAQQGYGFLFDNFKELFATDKFMGLTSEAMDYAVQQQMMFFDLKPTYETYDDELYTRICEYFDEQSVYFRVYGWVDQEGSGLDFVGRYGGLLNPVGNQNLSLYHVIPVDETFTQKSEFVLDGYDPTKTYVTFLASEGDTFKAPMTFQQGSWLDPYRGSVPINWGHIGVTALEFPIITKYTYDTMTTNDYFFSGGSSSVGYVDIDTQMPSDAVAAIVAYNQLILQASDQAYVDTYNDLFMFGDTFSPTFTGDYLIASGYTGAFGINPWEPTGPIYMSDMLFYNRRNVFYPRRGYSSLVNINNLTVHDSHRYEQPTSSDYWYIQTDLVRTTTDEAVIRFFTQANGDGYAVEISGGTIRLIKTVGGTELVLDERVAASIGTHELIVSVDRSSSMLDETVISVYFDKTRLFHLEDASFAEGGFELITEASVTTTFTNLIGQHMGQAEEIYHKILNDPNQFVVGYYGVVFDHDFTLSQYKTEPGPGEVVSLSPTDFYRIMLLLDENHPDEYVIVNMEEFYTYLQESLNP